MSSEIVTAITADGPAGEIARTLLFPYLNNAAGFLETSYATAADIDAGLKLGANYPVGPIALIGELGPQVVIDGLTELHAKTGDPLHVPSPVLASLASAPAEDEAAPEFKQEITVVGVVGTGTLASGIIQVSAAAGYDVVVVGRGQDKLDAITAFVTKNYDRLIEKGRATEDDKSNVLDRITGSTERTALGDADIVIEAIAEDLELKKALFAELDQIAKPGAILATNTSSLSIAELAAQTGRPDKVVGLHFFNPATVLKLVEVVSAGTTGADTTETAKAFARSVGKHPISAGDRAGFIVNALLFPYLNDAVKLSEAGGYSLAEIDDAQKATGLPLGPFELLDLVGNDVSLAIQRTLYGAFGHKGWAPAPTLVAKVEAGELGRKTKKGFHDYS
ncbi:MAG: 3-hydroxyacyl-CoA dehydrogenase NAD-binding domain-containing protein [Nocardioides sp.]|uniref:3-hydroxyacyl-CoA dehydrogenase family protein n=1 Tax=Nocardioides sp. TaxID=35761 RepID=UPI0039E5D2DE